LADYTLKGPRSYFGNGLFAMRPTSEIGGGFN
jgi:hypothetical protein